MRHEHVSLYIIQLIKTSLEKDIHKPCIKKFSIHLRYTAHSSRSACQLLNLNHLQQKINTLYNINLQQKINTLYNINIYHMPYI
jgi:hypothetical protein